MKSIQVPKEIQDIFAEAVACELLSADHDSGVFPSMKAVYYRHRAVKAAATAWRILRRAYPEVDETWAYSNSTGLVSPPEGPVAPKPKRIRVAKPKADALAPVFQE